MTTSLPIPGVTVTATVLAGTTLSIEGLINAVSDAQGRYRLLGLPNRDGHRLSVHPPLNRPYFVTDDLEVPAGPGVAALPFDIGLKSGVWVTGRVTDAETGAPVQAAVQFYPYLDNPNARGFPNYNANRVSYSWTGSRHRTDADGRFRVLAVPGRGVLAAKSFDRTYRSGVGIDALPEKPARQSMRSEALATYNQVNPKDFQAVAAVDVPDGSGGLRHDFVLKPSRTLDIRLVDPEGKPLTDATVHGRFPGPIDHPGDRTLGGEGLATIVGLDEGVARAVVGEHKARALGGLLVVTGGDVPKGEQTLRLRPVATVEGRVVDPEGRALTGFAEVRVVGADGKPLGNRPITPSEFGDDGRFRVTLPPGGPYSIGAVFRPAGTNPDVKPFMIAERLTPEPDQKVDLGTFDVSTGKRVDPGAAKGE